MGVLRNWSSVARTYAPRGQLHAATASVGVAMANMLPQITLSGSAWQRRHRGRRVFAGRASSGPIGASLTQTLFAGGTLCISERAARSRSARPRPAMSIGQAVLTAFQNVADALRALAADADAVRATDRACRLSSPASGSHGGNTAGRGEFLWLVSAQQTFQQALVIARPGHSPTAMPIPRRFSRPWAATQCARAASPKSPFVAASFRWLAPCDVPSRLQPFIANSLECNGIVIPLPETMNPAPGSTEALHAVWP